MAEKRFNRSNAVAVICAAILVGTEIIAAALALGWAVGGLMELGREFTLGLIGICFAFGVYLTFVFVRSAMKAEPFYE
ncbi:MAG: hypothetical protein ACRDBL_05350 [Rhabdaerophilum sp.]